MPNQNFPIIQWEKSKVSWCVIDALTPKHYFAMEPKSFYPIDREKNSEDRILERERGQLPATQQERTNQEFLASRLGLGLFSE
ncbi:hypothetical protein HZH68_012213 [Vespula germanica]|uniref:Uncharacterized protein n=1 Tax=Vespula germanica TaxID=30212 RepID=A0A834JIM0_VESGE|nr:hypothetical protein HZH68_012213 [Vespula germanica]